MIFNPIVLAALASVTLASPISNNRVVHEKREIINSIKGDRIDPEAVIPVRVGLKQSNLEHGYDVVMDVSDPQSSNYGKHWSLDQVRKFFAPKDESVEAVKQWLIESGIDPELIGESDDRAWIGFNIPAKQAEELLGAEYHEHEAHDESMRIGCDEYSLPSHISNLVDYVKPGISLSPPMKKRSITRRQTAGAWNEPLQVPTQGPKGKTLPPQLQSSAKGNNSANSLANCGEEITPACIRALYNIPRNKINNPANALGIAEFSPDAYSQQDLNEFFANFAPYVPQGTHPKLYSIDGGKAPVAQQNAGGESDIDFDIAISLVYPQTTTLYQVGPFDTSGYTAKQAQSLTFLTPLLDGIDGSFCTNADRKDGLQCGVAPIPRVLSVSYGSAELFNYQKGVERSCNEIMKLTLQGSTIIFASGDYGVAALPSKGYNGCINKDLTLGQSGTIFSPQFPADCPYVLAVGATQLYANETVNDPEYVLYQPELVTSGVGGAIFSSSGGFSNYFKRPSYQASAVQGYLNNYAPNYKSYVYNGNDIFSGNSNIGQNGGIYNRAGRGIPDVSANGANLTAFVTGLEEQFYGTSLAAPIWGSVITLINEERTKAGAGPVGFVNPVLYQNPGALNDITMGTNPGCHTQGFPASPGWDPSTGLGTPNFPALLKVFMKASGGWNGGYGS